MYFKITKNKEERKKTSDLSWNNKDCIVSKASSEIMLDRFSNGKEIDFPFSK